jgi:hypothetical protein
LTGEGRIENLFPLRGGVAVVIGEGLTGRVEAGGELEYEGWRWPYEGPETADLLPSGAKRLSLVVREPAAAKVLRAGGVVSFYAPGES